jgi:hypothetical protein
MLVADATVNRGQARQLWRGGVNDRGWEPAPNVRHRHSAFACPGRRCAHWPLGRHPAASGRRSPSLAQTSREYHMKHVMIDALEKRLIAALKSVDAHGDVAPAHVHDPMTMLLRENAIQASLMRWDDARGRYVLTGTGRRRISARARAPGTVVSFGRRSVVGGGAAQRKPANANLKE